MPTYSYKCDKCGVEFDKFCKITMRDRPILEGCPECHEDTIKQVIGSPNIVSGVRGLHSSTDDGFKEVLSKIASEQPKNHKINI